MSRSVKPAEPVFLSRACLPAQSRFILLAAVFLVLLSIDPALAAITPDYTRDIKPIFEKRCYSCHSHLKQKADLRLDAGALIHKGGKHGAVLRLGHAGESELIQRVTSADEDERMPTEGKPLNEEQVALLKAWVDAGAPFPANEKIPSTPGDHWAFQPVKRPEVPNVRNQAWVRNPIDNFILAKLEAAGIAPAPPASPGQWLRRAYLDLIGLPPTLAEQDQFIKSANAGTFQTALDAIVDSLLARPQHGERWARHWLDLVRYADSNGYERDAAKPFVWRYRDWVIRALNEDKPYDRFLLEQLAGDELPDANAGTMIATGMLRLAHWDDEPADPDTDRFDQLDDIVSTTSQALLGLTLGCARCHDHKFEPLSARDYYSMIAVFNPLQRPQNGRTELTRPVGTSAELAELLERDRQIEQLNRASASVRAAFREKFLQSGWSKLGAEVIAAFQTPADKRTDAQKKLAGEFGKKLDAEVEAALPAEIRDQIAANDRAIAKLRTKLPDLPQAYVWQEPSPKPPPTHVLLRGNPKRHGEAVEPAVPAILNRTSHGFPPPGERTTHRRLGLAQWIASPDNTLTARVIVNRVWQQHFGVGLVRTPSDFGLMGEPPTHPELLDWLADWFVRDAQWSLKKLHRLMLTSQTWRMSRVVPADSGVAAERDPENRLLSRLPLRRLEVEAIRDSVLAVSGQLNLAMFGPSVFPRIQEAAIEANTDKHSIWKPSPEADAARRTIYVFIKRGLVVPMLELLDLCDTVNSTARRPVTTIAPQALTLFNGDFVNEQARHLAARLFAEAGTDASRQIEHAFHLALARAPTQTERENLLEFLRTEAEQARAESSTGTPSNHAAARRHALEQLCRVVLNLNEFVYPD